MMLRRTFIQLPAAAGALSAATTPAAPKYRIVDSGSAAPGGLDLPGKYPGKAVSITSSKVIDTQTLQIDRDLVRTMLDRSMAELTGASKPEEAWRAFIRPTDRVGIKVNCSGAPRVMSSPEVVAEIARNLIAIGVPAKNITIYERFPDQLKTAKYEEHVPQGVRQFGVENTRGTILNYDPYTYVEVDFFGEEDTRSNLVKAVVKDFDKIINVPNMKEHQAAGVTGCLKNMAYGNFSNVARSHRNEVTNTKTFIGTLASVEPLRSKVVLHVMDGLKGVWHAGPFVREDRFMFFPKQMMVGTDPVALDRLLIDVIEDERKRRGAVSIWDRSMSRISQKRGWDPERNAFIREPGHVEYASSLGLGIYDKAAIKHKELEV